MASPISIIKTENEKWFKISNYDEMRPFFMNVVSDSNHWMFISSNGGLSAGRKNAEYALFPYYTDDKIADLAETTGSKTILRVNIGSTTHLWEPFSDRQAMQYRLSRNLYKNWYGNKILFEEINHDLGVTFRYQWNSSNLYGFAKKSELENHSGEDRHISVLDGIQNVLPYGIESAMQQTTSNLADAYKRTELIKDTGLGIFALSAIIVDKAEPSEALKANIAWSLGLDNPTYLVSSLQLNRFRDGKSVQQEDDIKGERGAYFVQKEIEIQSNSSKEWKIVANVNQNQSQIVELNKSITEKTDLDSLIYEDIEKGSRNLLNLIAGADGLQFTDDQLKDARHYSNVLYNIMRGGTFDHNYDIDKKDFSSYLKNASKEVFERHQTLINRLNNHFDKAKLRNLISDHDDPDLQRLCKEYLPLKFSRRHGDPSRPWNQFSINTYDESDGSKVLDYEGNWRDIFQNWEALVYSYPDFIEGMIFKFLNASTFDGYNPYRVTKGGFDWETIDPDDPWSYIGYWGDHQVIYLLKFLEFYNQYQPENFDKLLGSEQFAYANVPYRIKPYSDIVSDPKNTIDFDEASDRKIRADVAAKGADGALLESNESDIHHVNFLEKILAMLLAKVSNFIPEAGIWMNTQRPEWNDANNALVGNGVSMVTLCYLRRFVSFFEEIVSRSAIDDVPLSKELHQFFLNIVDVLNEHEHLLDGEINDIQRKVITDALGKAGSDYRDKIYSDGFSGEKVSLSMGQIAGFIKITRKYTEHTIDKNRRPDHLYHAYNLMSMSENGISVSYLEEMLEGQVAAISSGYLDSREIASLLDSLRNSALYREDQNSYMLYPNKELPRFLEKNVIPKESIEKSSLLTQMVHDSNRKIVNKDVEGGYHFNGNFRNAHDLKEALENLKSTNYRELVESESDLILEIFENVFNHKAFTGRSGTFFAYEGLGSIYWHMVSKLHLAVTEACVEAINKQVKPETVNRLLEHHSEIQDGIGIHKSPELYGAFPTDPYSHTPWHRGAQQPGMTGQVKEDILARWGELGVFIDDNRLHFNPSMLNPDEFSAKHKDVETINIDRKQHRIELDKNSLCFTFCQIPVIYQLADRNELQVDFSDGSSKSFDNLSLDSEISQSIFQRTGDVTSMTVSIKKSLLNCA